MDSIEIYVRVWQKDSLVKLELVPSFMPEGKGDILWESKGKYRLEVFQCGHHPSICSVEKDPRILNPKFELTLMILDALKKLQYSDSFF